MKSTVCLRQEFWNLRLKWKWRKKIKDWKIINILKEYPWVIAPSGGKFTSIVIQARTPVQDWPKSKSLRHYLGLSQDDNGLIQKFIVKKVKAFFSDGSFILWLIYDLGLFRTIWRDSLLAAMWTKSDLDHFCVSVKIFVLPETELWL